MVLDNLMDGFCPHCRGTGRVSIVTDALIGSSARARRQNHKITARQVARVMGVSPQYVSDLERGRRAWTFDLLFRYGEAVDHLQKGASVKKDE